ncbi:MAG: DUF4129 domain-containing protein [Dactylosporangium sp.]|nr:DUF4129 domain-containing protein [Dactylosporangium sp.]NNJ60133.1 DUF4129 domain-containing protein [Dactylosporangium sp.]
MVRWWVRVLAAVTDVVSLPLLIILIMLLASIVAIGWFTWPSWVPRRMPRWPRRRRKPSPSGKAEPVPPPAEPAAEPEPEPEALPDQPAQTLADLADRLAAQGRYAEAVRARLRAVVRRLVDRGIIGHEPGWTVTELADAAATTHPPVGAPLRASCGLFSELWYGMRPASRSDDERMRGFSADIEATLAAPIPAGPTTGGQA